ncbi:Gldg family protein [Plectonema radiosum NIES-515]|uniref:Gldg family protein n=1 Tax=Plectonema radiosum NIES-515 TaxID=2986073 RepID=A0ABT3B1A7_9CYAN|nr:Gldg family protein [Plectonema radiosum]MCV3215161.1 Gldg family protein [Plectonema radiosum NIES-515]
MKIVAKRTLWKYLFWLGPFFLVAGLTAGLISRHWGAIPLAFLIAGIAILGFCLIWQTQRTNWWGRRSTQAGTNAMVATLAVLAILGFINFLGTRYHLRTDLTDTQIFTLAPQSRELVHSLQKPAKVWVFDVNRNPQDLELLENYRRQSSNFKFEFVDPQTRPGLADKFGVKDYGEVYLESQDRRQLVQVVNPNERLSEIRLTNRLQQINSTTTAKVYLLQGHGERQLATGEGAISQAVQALSDKNFTTSALNLAEKSAVPDDAAVVIVPGAKKALFDNEVKALQTYLNRGGNLLLMIDPNTDPKLDSLLQEWGVRLDNRLAVNVSNNVGLGPAVALVTEYGQHPITKDFGNSISVYPFARPLEVTPVPGVESTTLIVTKPYPSSWAESDLQSENLQFNEGSDRKGPLTLGVALKRKLSAKPAALPTPTPNPSPLPSPTTQTKASPTPRFPPGPTPPLSPTSTESRLVVLGNSDFATDGLFQQQLNADVFLNSVTWLSQQDQQPLSIRPKEVKNRRINITGMQANLLALSSLVILPLIGLAAATVLWWKRR